MEASVFNEIRSIVYEHSGIQLKDGKETMVAARIAQRLRALTLDDELAYLEYLKADLEREVVQLLDVVSTNVTHFFRESEHFEALRGFVEGWLDQGQRRFRFWSAASSTGEEPYTLAMTLRDVLERRATAADVRILATDISTRVLRRAEAGVFEAAQLERVPKPLRRRYFEAAPDTPGACVARDSLRSLLLFRRLNLSQPPFPMRGPMDAIFVRNVMIYFDDGVRERLIAECHRLLRPGGYLIVGKSESLVRSAELFDRAGPSIYRRRGA